MPTISTPSGPVELTEKQFDALDLAARHLNTKQIARDLAISPRTVQAHLDAARQRLGVATRAEAVQLLLDTPSADTCSATPIVDQAPELAETPSPRGTFEFHDAAAFREPAPWVEAPRSLSDIEPRHLGKGMRVLLIVAIAALTMVLLGSGLVVADALASMLG
jgi:DNA-binding CsgD family transcriptional regulator